MKKPKPFASPNWVTQRKPQISFQPLFDFDPFLRLVVDLVHSNVTTKTDSTRQSAPVSLAQPSEFGSLGEI